MQYITWTKDGEYHFDPVSFGEEPKIGDITRGGCTVVHVGTLEECSKIAKAKNPPAKPLFDALK